MAELLYSWVYKYFYCVPTTNSPTHIPCPSWVNVLLDKLNDRDKNEHLLHLSFFLLKNRKHTFVVGWVLIVQ